MSASPGAKRFAVLSPNRSAKKAHHQPLRIYRSTVFPLQPRSQTQTHNRIFGNQERYTKLTVNPFVSAFASYVNGSRRRALASEENVR